MELYQQIFFSTLALAFALLHGTLFYYNPRLKSNLYFSIFLVLYALNIFFDFQASLSTDLKTILFYLRIHRAVVPLNPIFLLLFLYSVFEHRIPKQFWVITSGLLITGIFAVYEPRDNFLYIQIFLIAIVFEAGRVFYSAISKKKEGAFLIVVGFSLLFLFSTYDLLLDISFIQPVYNINNGYPFGFVFLIISISIHLAKNFANINRKIIEQKIRTKEMELNERVLKAEDARKSSELEEARKIQLSMLPECLPDIKGIDICFDMRTASEVGGDYYDYQLTSDGELIIALGDATGHGMRAGQMVSVIKTLFITHGAKMGITDFFEEATRTIKKMKLNNLYMSMMLVKLKDGHLSYSSAGMPPIYIYRYESKQIEEFVVKGMPLGAFNSFSYQTLETQLQPGDTLLLMSDGFPELFNDRNEILDTARIKEMFVKFAERPSNEIVNNLFASGDQWRKNKSLNDDITFVVCKMNL